MSLQLIDRAKAKIVYQANQTFLEHGFSAITMAKLAQACGLSRRALYHHFSNKDEIFRATMQVKNIEALEAGDAASQAALERGEGPVDVISAWLDARFGETRRAIGATPHGRELNDTAFRVGADIMIEVSYESNRKLAELVEELVRRGQMALRDGVAADKAARLLADGARGVNQARPPIPNSEIAQHYRDITEAVLFGCAKAP